MAEPFLTIDDAIWNVKRHYPDANPPRLSVEAQRIGKLRSTLRAIVETLDDHELRQAAREALQADDDAHGVMGMDGGQKNG